MTKNNEKPQGHSRDGRERRIESTNNCMGIDKLVNHISCLRFSNGYFQKIVPVKSVILGSTKERERITVEGKVVIILSTTAEV